VADFGGGEGRLSLLFYRMISVAAKKEKKEK